MLQILQIFSFTYLIFHYIVIYRDGLYHAEKMYILHLYNMLQSWCFYLVL